MLNVGLLLLRPQFLTAPQPLVLSLNFWYFFSLRRKSNESKALRRFFLFYSGKEENRQVIMREVLYLLTLKFTLGNFHLQTLRKQLYLIQYFFFFSDPSAERFLFVVASGNFYFHRQVSLLIDCKRRFALDIFMIVMKMNIC